MAMNPAMKLSNFPEVVVVVIIAGIRNIGAEFGNYGVAGAKVIVLGLTFKEDCPDLRNSRVEDILQELKSYYCDVHVHDPVADPEEAKEEYGVELTPLEGLPKAQAVVLAVAHEAYRNMKVEDYAALMAPNGVLLDVKSILDRDLFSQNGLDIWRL